MLEYVRVNYLSTHQILSFLKVQYSAYYRDSTFIRLNWHLKLLALFTCWPEISCLSLHNPPTFFCGGRGRIPGINVYLKMESNLTRKSPHWKISSQVFIWTVSVQGFFTGILVSYIQIYPEIPPPKKKL